jgi:histone deacetylase complex regulatory component SIN3
LQLLLFRHEVKQSFASLPHVHHQLVHLLSTFNMKKISEQQLISSVELLLLGHDELVKKFLSIFEQTQHTYSELIRRVEKCLASQPGALQEFVALVRNAPNRDAHEVYSEIAALLHDHADLLDYFERTMKQTKAAEAIQRVRWTRGIVQVASKSGTRVRSDPNDQHKRIYPPIIGIARPRPSSWGPDERFSYRSTEESTDPNCSSTEIALVHT